MLATAQKSGPTRASQPARATLCAAPVQITAAGLQHDGTETGTRNNRCGERCCQWPSSMVSTGSLEAGRSQSFKPTNNLRKLPHSGKCQHWLERNANRGILRRICASPSTLAHLSSRVYHGLRISGCLCILLTQNGNPRRRSSICDGLRSKYRIGNNRGVGNSHSARYCPKRTSNIRAQRLYGYGFYTSSHIHSVYGNPCCNKQLDLQLTVGRGNLTCGGGFGGGLGRGGAGACAKVFLLDSVGISRMEKAGEYGNRLSRISATLAVRP